MRVAFAAEENKGIESTLAYHFGRCPYYVFVDIENNEVKNVVNKENPYYETHEPGVVPQFIAKEGANVIIAGGMGPRAIDWFKTLGIQPITGGSGNIKDVLNEYLAGRLSGAGSCDEDE